MGLYPSCSEWRALMHTSVRLPLAAVANLAQAVHQDGFGGDHTLAIDHRIELLVVGDRGEPERGNRFLFGALVLPVSFSRAIMARSKSVRADFRVFSVFPPVSRVSEVPGAEDAGCVVGLGSELSAGTAAAGSAASEPPAGEGSGVSEEGIGIWIPDEHRWST